MKGSKENAQVTVVIPFFNAENTIERTIESVIRQSDVNVQLILVNDGSTDRSCELVLDTTTGLGSTTIDLESNIGAASARNRGLALARHDCIQFLDADDCLVDGKLKRQIGMLAEGCVSFIAGAYVYKRQGSLPQLRTPNSNVWMGLLKSELGRTSSNLFSTQTLRDIAGFNTGLKTSQEYDLMYRVLKIGGTCVIDNVPLTEIHSTEGSLSNTDTLGNIKRFLALRTNVICYLHETGKLTRNMKLQLKRHYQEILLEFPEEFSTEVWNLTINTRLDVPV